MGKIDSSTDAIRQRIFSLLKEQKISQKDFAAMIGLSPQAISDWKKGVNTSFTKHLGIIAEALQTTPGWLFSGTGEKSFSMEQRRTFEAQEHIKLASMQKEFDECESQLKSETKAIFQNKAKEFGVPVIRLLDNNMRLASYLGFTTSELLDEEKEPTPASESKPLYPPEYDLLDPTDRALIDNMIRRLIQEKNQEGGSSPLSGAGSETA